MAYTLRVIKAPTVLKTSPAQSSELPLSEKYQISDTTVTDERPWALAAFEEHSKNSHVRFTLDNATLGGRKTWWAYCPHVRIEGTEDGNNPKDEEIPRSNLTPNDTAGLRKA